MEIIEGRPYAVEPDLLSASLRFTPRKPDTFCCVKVGALLLHISPRLWCLGQMFGMMPAFLLAAITGRAVDWFVWTLRPDGTYKFRLFRLGEPLR